MRHSTCCVLSAGAAAHDEDPYGRFVIDSILLVLQPAIEPAQPQAQQVRGNVASELGRRAEVDVAGKRFVIVAMSPGTEDQMLRTALAPLERDIVVSCGARVRVVPR